MATTVRVEGLKEASAQLARFSVTKAMVAFVDGAAPRIETGLREWAPYRTYAEGEEQPGHRHLRDSIRHYRTTESGRVREIFTSDVKQARFVIEGTRAHGPVNATFLSWVQDNHRIFAKWVRGVEANPFPLHYVQFNHRGLQSEFARAVQRTFADAGRGL